MTGYNNRHLSRKFDGEDITTPYIELAKHNKIIIELNDDSEEKLQELKKKILDFEKAVDIDIVHKIKDLLKNFKIKITLEVD